MRRHALVRLWAVIWLAFLSQLIASHAAFARDYVTTGNTGARTQIDASHTSTICLFVTGSSVGFGGGNITLKRGSNAVEGAIVTFLPGTTCSGTPLYIFALGPDGADNSFVATPFQISGIQSLSAGNNCTTLTSPVADQRDEGCFIGSHSSCPVLTTSGKSQAVRSIPHSS